MKTKLNDILTIVQFSRASHQKNLKVLQKYYEKIPLDEFVEEICTSLKKILCTNLIKNENVQRTLDFLAQFISAVTPVDVEEEAFLGGDAPHPFLTRIIVETLKYHDVAYDFVRYNSCLFIRLILHRIGHDTNLDNEVCDLIEEAMLERTQDPKASVRLQAVMALLRLQVPTNPDCPVISAFLSMITDSNAAVRAEIVKTIAPYIGTIPQIVKRLRDVDPTVRIIAFRRCADLGPKYFKIVERQHILKCGLCENHPKAKKVFMENLLVKWLNAYGENYVEFLKALKLDGDESDIANTQEISKRIMTVLLDNVQITNVSEVLSLENKLIPLKNLSSETSALWNISVAYLRQHEELEEYLEKMIPELTSFSNYIESLSTKVKERQMEDWENLDYQETLINLFEIVEGFDLSDEVGRKTLYQLTLKLLKEDNLQFKVKKKMMLIAAQVAPKSECFITTVCHIISDIQEPLIESPCMSVIPAPADDINKDCLKAELKVKIIKLSSQLEDATDNQEFLKADSLKKEIDKLKTEMEELTAVPAPPPQVEVAKVSKDDPKTTCQCLDLLIALLELPSTKKMTPSLSALKDEFVMPLLETNVVEVNSRVLNCLAVYCFIDESLVEQCVKILSIPIITYRKIPNYNKNALLISVKAIADLFHQYGENIFGGVADTTNNTTSSTNPNRRRLYNDNSDDSFCGDSPGRFHLESIIEVMLDMLDDEVSEIRETAVAAITKLAMNNFPVTSPLITRIVLKWYNPLTVNGSDNLQQLLGMLIVNYTNCVKGAREVIVKAVVPILNSIANAPNTSPLADVDVDNLLRFLAVITNADDKKELASTHLAMAHMFCYEMVKKKNASIVHYLSKMMLLLEIPSENSALAKELVAQLEVLLDEENNSLDKSSRRNLVKFLTRLKISIEETQNATRDGPLETIAEETSENNVNVENQNQEEEPSEAIENPVAIEENLDKDKEKTVEDSPLSGSSDLISSSSSGNKDTSIENDISPSSEQATNVAVTENKKKRPRRSANDALLSSSETDDEAKKTVQKRKSKRLKVCTSRLKTPTKLKHRERSKGPLNESINGEVGLTNGEVGSTNGEVENEDPGRKSPARNALRRSGRIERENGKVTGVRYGGKRKGNNLSIDISDSDAEKEITSNSDKVMSNIKDKDDSNEYNELEPMKRNLKATIIVANDSGKNSPIGGSSNINRSANEDTTSDEIIAILSPKTAKNYRISSLNATDDEAKKKNLNIMSKKLKVCITTLGTSRYEGKDTTSKRVISSLPKSGVKRNNKTQSRLQKKHMLSRKMNQDMFGKSLRVCIATLGESRDINSNSTSTNEDTNTKRVIESSPKNVATADVTSNNKATSKLLGKHTISNKLNKKMMTKNLKICIATLKESRDVNSNSSSNNDGITTKSVFESSPKNVATVFATSNNKTPSKLLKKHTISKKVNVKMMSKSPKIRRVKLGESRDVNSSFNSVNEDTSSSHCEDSIRKKVSSPRIVARLEVTDNKTTSRIAKKHRTSSSSKIDDGLKKVNMNLSKRQSCISIGKAHTRRKHETVSRGRKHSECGRTIAVSTVDSRSRNGRKGRENNETVDSSDSETTNKKRPKLDRVLLNNGDNGLISLKKSMKAKDRINKAKSKQDKGNKDESTAINNQENNERLSRVKRITRNGSKLSEELNSSTETILHTILHDISEMSVLQDVSSFESSPNQSIISRKSLRLSSKESSNEGSPIIKPMPKRVDRVMKEKPAYANVPPKRSTRNMRNK
ncbi:unnamed protein product [Phaedon cochleariae]|uniref:Nuclear condensin complex subunit 3 C-terminal domain-containing protein n=1 Tax=Phaedon cochleariae TaxID=80249 RepID=A0A9N9SCA6_PHACE|nr:unnamed protein product [Phaedon cochleariae]